MLTVLAIDPGLGSSHAAILRGAPSRALNPRYAVDGFLNLYTPERAPHDFLDLARPVADAVDTYGVNVIAVESPRGTIVPKRDADPVLRAALMSGRIVGALGVYLPAVPVIEAPAFGPSGTWAWRQELGLTGATDDAIRAMVQMRLDGVIPHGVRGGKQSHFVDAAGLGVAVLDRLLSRLPGSTDPLAMISAFYARSPLEAALDDHGKRVKVARRTARKARKAA